MNKPDYINLAATLRSVADSVGIVCNQAHAPYPSSVGDERRDAVIFQKIVRSMEIAAILGAKNIVVHPKQHLKYTAEPNAPERLFELNLAFYNALIPYCKQYGIHVAIENMWQFDKAIGRISHSTCSKAEKFIRYIDTINSEWIVACLDIGHTALVQEDITHMIGTLGNKRLQALHVHDVDMVSDLHTLPYHAKINYDEVTGALAEIGYEGDLTFEADLFFSHVPDRLKADSLKYMQLIGRHLIAEIKAKRQSRQSLSHAMQPQVSQG